MKKEKRQSKCKLYKPSTYYTKEEKRVYMKMVKMNTQKLKVNAKNFRPSDYGFLLDLLESMLVYMRDYYSQTTYVLQADESRLKILHQIQTALGLYEEYKKNEESYIIDCDSELESIKKFFSYIGEHILEWWD